RIVHAPVTLVPLSLEVTSVHTSVPTPHPFTLPVNSWYATPAEPPAFFGVPAPAETVPPVNEPVTLVVVRLRGYTHAPDGPHAGARSVGASKEMSIWTGLPAATVVVDAFVRLRARGVDLSLEHPKATTSSASAPTRAGRVSELESITRLSHRAGTGARTRGCRRRVRRHR